MIVIQLFIITLVIGFSTWLIARKEADLNFYKFLWVAGAMWITKIFLIFFVKIESNLVVLLAQSVVGWYTITKFLYVRPMKSLAVVATFFIIQLLPSLVT